MTTTETPLRASVPLDPLLLEILVCPVTREKLRYDAAAGELVSEAAGLAFPVVDGIPVMLPDEARRLEEPPIAD